MTPERREEIRAKAATVRREVLMSKAKEARRLASSGGPVRGIRPASARPDSPPQRIAPPCVEARELGLTQAQYVAARLIAFDTDRWDFASREELLSWTAKHQADREARRGVYSPNFHV